MSVNLPRPESIPGVRKAAILLVMLGEEISAELLRQLEEQEVQAIGREVARLSSVTSEQAELVLDEFHQMSIAHDYVLKGGIDYARKLLITAYGPEAAKKVLDRLMTALGTEVVNFDALHKADPQQLAKFIHNEHPQTIAPVLSHLNPTQAASLLVSLPAGVPR